MPPLFSFLKQNNSSTIENKIISTALLLCFVLLVSDTLAASGTANEKDKWVITRNAVFLRNGTPKNALLKKLVKQLESEKGEGAKVTKAEFISYLERPEARQSYPDVLIKYASPESEEITKKEHLNFLDIHLKENNLVKGIDFLIKYDKLLSEAENKYGVLKRDIVSILEWESGLGRVTGNYNAFVVLLSQVLFLDDAQKYARMEIIVKGGIDPFKDKSVKAFENKRIAKRKLMAMDAFVSLLRNCKKLKIDPLMQKSSWGGAFGFVQFMPNNFNLAVDGDNNGVLDLWSWPDAIYSAANFLKQKGYKSSTDSTRIKAFFRYNPSKEYADGVLIYAEAVWKRYLELNKK